MSVYLLAYDLVQEKKNPQHDYQVLWDELKRLGAHRTQYSLWLLNVNNTPRELVNHFKQFVDGNDPLWITRLVTGEYSFNNARSGTNDWLATNPPETR
jgi:CRISPR/Cas system-associated endoribonuclease Cas2